MRTRLLTAALVMLAVAFSSDAVAKKKKGTKPEATESSPLSSKTFNDLELRLIGSALTSGRITDFAVNPERPAEYFVATASGGLWKTINAGTTFDPVFDDQGSYSIGCVTIDPNDHLAIWVGTGENNSQRSVAYGDGVYRSLDGGHSWTRMGLEKSEHIGMIVVDPADSNVVWVAAQGPLWAPGGDRGLYKSTDRGATWELALEISENTGVSEVHLDPRNPDIMYAVAYQRRRHVWTLLDGGPESGIHKSHDGGTTWTRLKGGLPKSDTGRIGLSISPVDPTTVYAIVNAADKEEAGFYRSTDAGSNWKRQSDYVSNSPQYYQEIVADPNDRDRVYSLDTFFKVTEDAGKSFDVVPGDYKHVDNHALWIDRDDTDHLLCGNDGGVYETWDRGQTWRFMANLPLTQFYRISADDERPFYNVYGGTQDNNSLGAPSRTTSASGIHNTDWKITLGGDGYETQVDPTNPDIVYSQYQYGGLVRHDRASGENIDIQPQPEPGEPALRWNWDSPLLLSPHSPTRLYFAANRLYRTDDRGDSWTAVSGDLTRQLDRNKLDIMGRVWSVDAVSKNRSTSFYGNIVSFDESPRRAGRLIVGTDDGLVQISSDAGGNWRRIDSIKGIPNMSYVSDVTASLHADDTVFVAFDNHKQGDFKPYLMRSDDFGQTWRSVAGDLPENGAVYSMVEDHVDPTLWFVGTEFGVFFSNDGGERWLQLKGKMPVIAVRDLEIQRRESDLIVGTFGRGVYILDDYSPLRHVAGTTLKDQEAIVFPVKDAWMFVESEPLGGKEKGNQGDSFFTAKNPPVGAVVTYYLRDALESARDARLAAEGKLAKDGEDVHYPDWELLRAEDRERDPEVIFTITDADGDVVRRFTGPTKAGVHRVAWDFRYAAPNPASTKKWKAQFPWSEPPRGPLAAPGRYVVAMHKVVRGESTPLGERQSFEAVPLGTATLPAADRAALRDFQLKTSRLRRASLGAGRALGEVQERVDHLRVALRDTPGADQKLFDRLEAVAAEAADLDVVLNGDSTVAKRSEPTGPALDDRISRIVYGSWSSTSAPTATHRRNYEIAAGMMPEMLDRLRRLSEVDLAELEREVESLQGPWTPGRVPRWQPD